MSKLELKEAEKGFLRHLKIYPEDEEVLERLSCIYGFLGKSDKMGKVLADLRKVRSRKELVKAGIIELKPLVEGEKN